MERKRKPDGGKSVGKNIGERQSRREVSFIRGRHSRSQTGGRKKGKGGADTIGGRTRRDVSSLDGGQKNRCSDRLGKGRGIRGSKNIRLPNQTTEEPSVGEKTHRIT